MKRSIIRNNLLLLLSAFALFFAVVFVSLNWFERYNQERFMSFLLDEVRLSYENYTKDAITFVEDYHNSNERRITILDENKIVLADSHDDTIGLDKSLRPELNDLGEVHMRHSATLDLEMMYIATQLDDGNYLRVAIPLASDVAIYSRIIWILVISAILLGSIHYFGLVKLNMNLLKPWQQIKEGLMALNEGHYQLMSLSSRYPEINELLNEMNAITNEMANHLSTIQTQQQRLTKILNEIKQGVMLFDSHNQLIFYNADAQNIFSLTEDALHQPNYYAIRDAMLNEAITSTLQNHHSQIFDLNIKSKIIEVKVFLILLTSSEKDESTVLVLLKDVTQERSLEQMKRDFFAHASHELKSPLTAIRGFSELIEYGLIQEQDVKDTAQKIVKQTEFMTALIEDMLMLSRLENMKEEVYSVQNLTHILQSVSDMFQALASSKRISLYMEVDEIKWMCDPLDMQKLFKNIIENAIKYSYDDQPIDVSLKLENNIIVFRVKDQGIGIDVKHQQRVFERFYRVDKGRLDGGTGLGLAIVKHITLKYHGQLHLDSTLNVGTTITILLPYN